MQQREICFSLNIQNINPDSHFSAYFGLLDSCRCVCVCGWGVAGVGVVVGVLSSTSSLIPAATSGGSPQGRVRRGGSGGKPSRYCCLAGWIQQLLVQSYILEADLCIVPWIYNLLLLVMIIITQRSAVVPNLGFFIFFMGFIEFANSSSSSSRVSGNSLTTRLGNLKRSDRYRKKDKRRVKKRCWRSGGRVEREARWSETAREMRDG